MYQKYKNTCTFNNGSRIHEIWAFRKVSWRLYYRAAKDWAFRKSQLTTILSSSKTKIQELRRREIWGYSLNFWEKNTSKEILKTSKPRNWTNISVSLSLVWSEKTAKTLNLQVLEVCFQVLIDIWKNVNIPSDVAFERARKCLEAKNKQLKKEGKGNRPNAAEALRDDINILYEKKPPGNFKRRSIDKHTLALQFTAFWSTRMWRASANVLGRRSAHERCRWNWIITFFWKTN